MSAPESVPDIAIVGGGLAGSALALGLSRKMEGHSTCLIRQAG